MKNTIVLADDHSVIRQALKAMLQDLDFEIIGEASDGLEAINLVNELKPDILIVDLMMGSMNGLEVTRRVSKDSPKTGVVVLSMYKDESYVVEALRAGAKAYVVKDSSTEDLLRAIHEAIAGKHYLGSSICERAIQAYSEKTVSEFPEPYDTLSVREKEVMRMVAEGMISREIGKLLCVSSRTIDTHRANIMRKLSLNSRADLIRFAQRRGILPPESAFIKR
jgi:two-component system, NarL family, response regulator NreC